MKVDRAVDERHLRHAVALAAEAIERGGGPFGAIVARGPRVLAAARNEVVESGDPTAHAEVAAIRRACAAEGTHVLTGCTLYASCEPCPMCLGAAWWARVDRIVMAATRDDAAAIGFDDAALYEEMMRPDDARVLRVERMLREEAVAAMTSWASDPRRVGY